MTILQLFRKLLNPHDPFDYKVYTYDPDVENLVEITSVAFDHEKKIVYMQTSKE